LSLFITPALVHVAPPVQGSLNPIDAAPVPQLIAEQTKSSAPVSVVPPVSVAGVPVNPVRLFVLSNADRGETSAAKYWPNALPAPPLKVIVIVLAPLVGATHSAHIADLLVFVYCVALDQVSPELVTVIDVYGEDPPSCQPHTTNELPAEMVMLIFFDVTPPSDPVVWT
jgi:hypothetical protein